MCKGIAARNSSARLLGGSTMHYMSGLFRGHSLSLRKPNSKALQACEARWVPIACMVWDESCQTPPDLVGTTDMRACWGRQKAYRLNPNTFENTPFGNMLLKFASGDFLQLNPVIIFRWYWVESSAGPRANIRGL